MKIAVICAFPHELKQILKQVKVQKRIRTGLLRIVYTHYLSHEIMAVSAGMGTRNAEDAFDRMIQVFTPDFLVSIGFGGALYDDASIGDLIMARSVSLVSRHALKTIQIPDPHGLIERLGNEGGIQVGSFFTLEKWTEKRAVKPLLSPEVTFPVCEMETFPLAKLARQRQLPFLAFRSITDRADEEIPPELLNLTDSSGCYRFPRAAGLLLCNPRLIPAAARFGRRSGKASKSLWHAFDSLARVL